MPYSKIINDWERRKLILENYKRIFKIKLKKIQSQQVIQKPYSNKDAYFKQLTLNRKKYSAFKNYIRFQLINNLVISKEIIYNLLYSNHMSNLIYLWNNLDILSIEDKQSLISSISITPTEDNTIDNTFENCSPRINNEGSEDIIQPVENSISKEKILFTNYLSIKNFFEIIDNCFISFFQKDQPVIVESILKENYLLIGINTKIYKSNPQYKKNLLLLFNQNINQELDNYFLYNLIYSSNRLNGKNYHYYLFMYQIEPNDELKSAVDTSYFNDSIIEKNLTLYINNLFITSN